jgi:AcrR family transcriptional regulator
LNKSRPKQLKLQRPRSLAAHEKALEAAAELFAGEGIEGASMDSIATRSGVSKATIYKHWPDKNALALEVLARVHGLDRKSPDFDSGDLLQDMIAFLNHKPPEEYADLRHRLMPHMVAYASRNLEFGRTWRARVMEPGRAKAIELLKRGIAEGYFPRDLDISICLALLIGPMAYQYIARNLAPAPDNLGEQVAKAFWRAFAIPGTAARPKTTRQAIPSEADPCRGVISRSLSAPPSLTPRHRPQKAT